jgi:mono/diheme cytochrome c family protein
MKKLLYLSISIIVTLFVYSCSPAEGNKTGHEYMPDMAHSVAYEANVDNYYYYHTWDSKETYHNYSKPKEPVAGTIARGYSGYGNTDSSSMSEFKSTMKGTMTNNAISTPKNGHVNYYYMDTPEDRIRAGKEITNNPFNITKSGLEKGKLNYDIYCGICHGAKGDGAGYLVRDDGGVYPAQPANFLKDEFIASSEGRFYHAIMYGLNVMGGYSDKLSYEERWDVIHYIRSLQAASKNLKYSESENSFTGSQAIADAKKASAAVANTASTAPAAKK